MANALPDLKLLRIFVSVVRHQGFANAQHELNLSTSAISTYMSQLEARWAWCCAIAGAAASASPARASCFTRKPCAYSVNWKASSSTPPRSKGSCAAPSSSACSIPPSATRPCRSLEVIGAYSLEHPAVHLHLSVMSPYELQLGVQDNRLRPGHRRLLQPYERADLHAALSRAALAVLQHAASFIQ